MYIHEALKIHIICALGFDELILSQTLRFFNKKLQNLSTPPTLLATQLLHIYKPGQQSYQRPTRDSSSTGILVGGFNPSEKH